MANKSIEDAILAINPDAAYRNTTPDNTSGITWIAGTAPIAAETLEAKKLSFKLLKMLGQIEIKQKKNF